MDYDLYLNYSSYIVNKNETKTHVSFVKNAFYLYTKLIQTLTPFQGRLFLQDYGTVILHDIHDFLDVVNYGDIHRHLNRKRKR